MDTPLRVLLVTSWNTPCGIAEHSRLLKASVAQADPKIEILPDSEGLDPGYVFSDRRLSTERWDLIHLNHHDGLHSRWTPGHVRELTAAGIPVLVTYHDTRAQLADCPKLEALAQVASSVVVHEPVEGLKAIYWRQGVPSAAQQPANYNDPRGRWNPYRASTDRSLFDGMFSAFPQQPVLGTVGFNFPWKNYDRLAQITGEEGWALVLLSNNATEEDEARWRALNSSILVVRKFLPQEVVINYLAGCDATAFMYECANTGTSGAIRQGIAARKPVIALSSCRQFRDLYDLDVARDTWDQSIVWVRSWTELPHRLGEIQPHHYYAPSHRLAHAESWTTLGANYAKLYRLLAGAR